MKKNKYAGQVKKRREAETLNASEKNMLAKVEQDRTLRQSLYHPIRVKAPDIPVDELIDYLPGIFVLFHHSTLILFEINMPTF